jgi:hypothetical protein
MGTGDDNLLFPFFILDFKNKILDSKTTQKKESGHRK